MSFAFVRPADDELLAGRPLLDLGTGDSATVNALTSGGLIIGVDSDRTLLRRGSVNATSEALPFAGGSFGVVLAADLFHHLDNARLAWTLTEIARVLRSGGRLIAWWYAHTSDPSPDSPRHARAFGDIARAAERAGLAVDELELVTAVSGSPTVGLLGRR